MIQKQTIDQFEIDFENASIDKKAILLEGSNQILDISDPEVKDLIQKLQGELQDLIAQKEIEENFNCVKDIDSGNLELYRNIKDYNEFKVGELYYTKIVDISADLREKFSGITDGSTALSSILDKINSMKPIIWIYYDNGIGSLKKREVFNQSQDFSEYFEKITK